MARYTKDQISEFYSYHSGRGKTPQQITGRLRQMMRDDPEAFGAEEANMILAADRGEGAIPSAPIRLPPELEAAMNDISRIKQVAAESQPMSSEPMLPYIAAAAPVIGGAAAGAQVAPWLAKTILPKLSQYLGPNVLKTLGMAFGGGTGATASELAQRRYHGGPLSAEDVKSALGTGAKTAAVIAAPQTAGDIVSGITGPTILGSLLRGGAEGAVGTLADVMAGPREKTGGTAMGPMDIGGSFIMNLLGGLGEGYSKYSEATKARVPAGMAGDLPVAAKIVEKAPEIRSLMESSAGVPSEARTAMESANKYITGAELQPEAVSGEALVAMRQAMEEAAMGDIRKFQKASGLAEPQMAEDLFRWLQEKAKTAEGLQEAFAELGSVKDLEEVGEWFKQKVVGTATGKVDAAKRNYQSMLSAVGNEPVDIATLTDLSDSMKAVLEDTSSNIKQVESGVLGQPRRAAADTKGAMAGVEEAAALAKAGEDVAAVEGLMRQQEFGGDVPVTTEDVSSAWARHKELSSILAKIQANEAVTKHDLMQIYRDINLLPYKEGGRAGRAMSMIRGNVEAALRSAMSPEEFDLWKQANAQYAESFVAKGAARKYFDPRQARTTTAPRTVGGQVMEEFAGQPGGPLKETIQRVGLTDQDLAELSDLAKQARAKELSRATSGSAAIEALRKQNKISPRPEYDRAIEILEAGAKKKADLLGGTKTLVPNTQPGLPEHFEAKVKADEIFDAMKDAGEKVWSQAEGAVLSEFNRLVLKDGYPDLDSLRKFVAGNPSAVEKTEVGKGAAALLRAITENPSAKDIATVALLLRGKDYRGVYGKLASANVTSPDVLRGAFEGLESVLGKKEATKLRAEFANGLLGEMANAEKGGKINLEKFGQKLNELNPGAADLIFGYDKDVLRRYKNAKEWIPVLADAMKAFDRETSALVAGRRALSLLSPLVGYTGGLAAGGIYAGIALGPDAAMKMVLSDKLPAVTKAVSSVAQKGRVVRAADLASRKARKEER